MNKLASEGRKDVRVGLFCETYQQLTQELRTPQSIVFDAINAAAEQVATVGETPDFGDKPYDPTAPVNIAAHAAEHRA